MGAESPPTISVVIPCRNEKGHIEECLRTVLSQEAVPGGFEVIVADGMSDDGTRAILARLADGDPRIRIIDNPGKIVSTGLNLAIRVSRGSVIARMDVHTEYAPDYLLQCLRVLQDTGADNVGGPWIATGRGYIGRTIAITFQSPFAVGGARAHAPSYEGPVDTVYLGCWRRDVFNHIGFFDEELVRNQDDEFNFRLIRAGGKIWQSQRIKSWYTTRGSLKALFRQYLQYGYWKIRVIQKHRKPASIRHLVPGSFVFCLFALPLITFFDSLAFWIWLGMMFQYLCCNVFASAATAARHGWRFLPVLPIVFACYHFGYGFGFLYGVLDFIVLRRAPSEAWSRLTRASSSRRRRAKSYVS